MAAAVVRLGRLLGRSSRVLCLQGARACGERQSDVLLKLQRNGLSSGFSLQLCHTWPVAPPQVPDDVAICRNACIVKSFRPVSMVPRDLHD